MPRKSIKKPPRHSVTAGMKSEAEKILSGVERGLLELLDSDDDGDLLSKLWPGAPTPCIVAVNTAKQFDYVFAIKERLKAEGFLWDPDAVFWYRPKIHGQLTLAQKARSERNRAAALEKLAKKRAAS